MAIFITRLSYTLFFNENVLGVLLCRKCIFGPNSVQGLLSATEMFDKKLFSLTFKFEVPVAQCALKQ